MIILGCVGLGCMRLSTATDRDDSRSVDVLRVAVASGARLLDSADAYCVDDTEVGHNERLIAAAIAGQPDLRPIIVTKGGLERPGGAWVPNGRGKHLAAAARASRQRLGVAIDLYLLHAIDPKVPLATSVRALARLRDEGVVEAIGLSNVTPTQLDAAMAITTIDAVEVELQPWKLDAVRGGLVARCEDNGIALLAHRPLGGPAGVKRIARDQLLREIAKRHAIDGVTATPAEVVLAWLRSLSPVITVLPGATRVETAASAIRGQRLGLDDDARRVLAAQFLAVARAMPATSSAGEIVVIVGMPGAGKSTLAIDYVARGYARLNRDERGGSLLALAKALDDRLAGESGTIGIVIDNTYPTRASRAPILEVAARHGVPVKCVVVATPIEQAQAHAAQRILDKHGAFDALDVKHEIRPSTQFRWRRDFEPPTVDEGFASIEEVAPARHVSGTKQGLIVELDCVVWLGKPVRPDKIELRPGVHEAIAAWRDHVVAATVWRPGATADAIAALAARLGELVGRSIDIRHCAHPAGPPVCWCRKPLPGLALAIARTHDLDLARSIHVGTGPADRGFATRAGMHYVTIDEARAWPRPAQTELARPARTRR